MATGRQAHGGLRHRRGTDKRSVGRVRNRLATRPPGLGFARQAHAYIGLGYFHLRWIHSQSGGLARISASSAEA